MQNSGATATKGRLQGYSAGQPKASKQCKNRSGDVPAVGERHRAKRLWPTAFSDDVYRTPLLRSEGKKRCH